MTYKCLALIGVLLLIILAVGWKGWQYRQGALAAMGKVEIISERFTRIDWFAEENQRWIESGERPDVVFLGASITKGWNPEGKLGDLAVAARGVPGQWPSHYLLRLKPDVLDLRPRAMVLKACAITFRPGVDENGTRAVLLEILEQAEAAGIRPVLATCVPVRADGNTIYHADGSKSTGGINDRLLPFNDWLRGLAGERGYTLIDFFTAMADESGFLPAALAMDDIHPNAAGYELMSATALPVLETLLAGEGR